MRLELSNGDYAYFSTDGIKLVKIDNTIYNCSNSTMYGIDENGTRVRLNSNINQNSSNPYNNYQLQYYTQYGNSYTWITNDITIENIPPSLNADDTFNFESFPISLIGIFILIILFVKSRCV